MVYTVIEDVEDDIVVTARDDDEQDEEQQTLLTPPILNTNVHNDCRVTELNEVVNNQLKSHAEEMRGLRDEIARNTEEIRELRQQVVTLSEDSASPTLSRNPRSSIFMRNATNHDGLPEDTFSLMIISRFRSHAWLLGLFTYAFQMILIVMIGYNQLQDSIDSSHFNVPFRVDPVVRVGQLFTIIFALATQNDIISSIRFLVMFWSDRRWYKDLLDKPEDKIPTRTEWVAHILIPNVLKFVQGILVILATFVVIVQSDNIIELLKDFTALMILSETDNIFFQIAANGYLGSELQRKTIDVRGKKMKNECSPSTSRSKDFLIRPIVLISITMMMIAGWLYIAVNQLNGTYFATRYPNCTLTNAFELATEHFGDGTCYGGPLNTLGCEFEGGDCIDFNLAFPLCKGENLTNVQDEVGNGICNQAFNTPECNFDGNDCDFKRRYPDCTTHLVLAKEHVGDGICYGGPLNTLACDFEGGDCINFNLAYPLCRGDKLTNVEKEIGNGICNELFNTPECNFDGNDCEFETRYPRCPHLELAKEHFGDGICYGGPLNSLECEFENGDCINFNLAFPLCKGDDKTDVQNRVGDGICDPQFRNADCNYDGGDCCGFIDDPAFGDGICDEEMNTEGCGYDNGDCLEYNLEFKGCPLEVVFNNPMFGDGQCNGGVSSTERCGYDNGDCNQLRISYPDCPFEQLSKMPGADDLVLGNGICDGGVYNTMECGFKFGDCGQGQVGQTNFINDYDVEAFDDLWFSKIFALDGSTMAIGFYFNEEDGSFGYDNARGLVKVWRYSNVRKMWLQLGKDIVGSNPGLDDRFGQFLSMSSSGNDIAITSRSGLRVFGYDNASGGNGKWSQVGQTLKSNAWYSYGSISADASRVALVSDLDKIKLYTSKNDSGGQSWVHDSSHDVINTGASIKDIYSVELQFGPSDGSRLLFRDIDTRLVKAFQKINPTAAWQQMGQDINISSTFSSMAISANRNRIAVKNSSATGTDASVQVLDYNIIQNKWISVGSPIKSHSPINGQEFAFTLDMSPDGNLLAIGSNHPECLQLQSGSSVIYPNSFDIQKCVGSKREFEVYTYQPKRNRFVSSPLREGARQPGEPNVNILSPHILHGLHVSLSQGDAGTFVSVSSYDLGEDAIFVDTYALDALFYSKCYAGTPEWVGDRECHDIAPYNSEACGYDGSACIPTEVEGYPGCFVYETFWIGDGICNDRPPYNTEVCGFDGGDCDPKPVNGYPECFVHDPSYIGNGVCNEWNGYDTEVCGFDGGDCDNETPILKNVFVGGSTNMKMCEGDCDSDDDCAGSLLCFFRSTGEPGPPGCSGDPFSFWDYCYPPPLTFISEDGINLGLCEGDCDSDDDCSGTLLCFQRDTGDPGPPGCSGDPTSNWDYCYVPPLTFISEDGINLGLCEGDCDSDDDCAGSYVCFQRDEEGDPGPPGCSGVPISNWDYCQRP